MSRITLRYTVPVYVTVDTEDKSVESVLVDDSASSYDGSGYNRDGKPDATDEEVEAAHLIAEEAEWPAWGWS